MKRTSRRPPTPATAPDHSPGSRAADRASASAGARWSFREPWLLPALTILVSRLLLWRAIPFAAEDAYITFRYARHFAHGFGMVFNPGERVFGFSSPLWTLWMGAGFAVGAPPVVWARTTSLVAELVTLVVVVGMLRRHASLGAAWCFAFFFAAWPYFGAVSVSGMESTLMLALVALSALGVEKRARWAGPALAALALVRPEGLAAAAVLAFRAGWRDRLVSLALVSAGLVALTLYFGSPMPQSVTAKSMLYGTPGPWVGRHWWEWLSPFVFGRFPGVAESGHLLLLSVIFAPAAFLGARVLWGHRRSALAAMVGACLVVWLGYALLGVAFFWWYLLVPLAGFGVLAAVGFPSLARGRGLYASAGLLILGMWTITPQLYIGRAQNEALGFGAAGSYLATHARPGQKVLLEPIGMIGYAAPLVVVDEVGLVSPGVARRRLQGAGWYTDVVASERPEWLVVRRGVLRGGQAFAGAGTPFRNLTERDTLLSGYENVAVADSLSGDMALLILRRR